MKTLSNLMLRAVLAGLVLVCSTALAQRGGGFDRGQMMDRLAERYQEVLEVSDDEWSVLKPMVIGIMEKQFSGRSSRFAGFGRGGGGGRGGRGGRGGDGERSNRGNRDRGNRADRNDRGSRGGDSPLSKAIETGDDSMIKSALAAHRAEQKKNASDLKRARNELRQLLTLKQEANLVMLGLLD